MNDQMAAIASEVGLEYNFDEAIINNTMNAHRLLHYAKTKGVQLQMKERIFKAYYTQGLDVANINTLATLAAEVGLNQGETKEILSTDTFTTEVLNDQQQAHNIGVQGVPFYVFNNKYAVSGAQPPEVFSKMLQKVWDEEKPALVTAPVEGFCGVEGNCN